MPREVKIEIKEEITPSFADYLFGTTWFWTVSERYEGGISFWRFKSGFARSEESARRKAEKAANRILEGTIQYSYNPAGLTSGDKGK